MKINGNQKTIAAATLGGALLVEEVIGGIGISMLGGAIGIPAAAIVVAGGAIALACGLGSDDESDTPSTPVTTSSLTTHLLVKPGVTHKFSVNQDRGWGQTCLKTASSPDWTNYRYFSTLGELRDFYKSLLQKGYKPA